MASEGRGQTPTPFESVRASCIPSHLPGSGKNARTPDTALRPTPIIYNSAGPTEAIVGPYEDTSTALASFLYGEQDFEWMEKAACKGVGHEIFFIGRGKSAAPAREYCRVCVVRQECFDFAIATGSTHGIWGGAAERDRRTGKLPNLDQECPSCGDLYDSVAMHRRIGPCAL